MAADPSSFTVTTSLSSVACSWTSSSADGYRVYRAATGSTVWLKVFEGGPSDLSFTDFVPNFSSGGSALEYDYQVRAFDSSGESAGVTDTAVMPDISTSNAQAVGVLAAKFQTASGVVTASTTYNNSSASVAISNNHRQMHEVRNSLNYDKHPI
jgi:hypothetical protein